MIAQPKSQFPLKNNWFQRVLNSTVDENLHKLFLHSNNSLPNLKLKRL